jgi:hypothetical protein
MYIPLLAMNSIEFSGVLFTIAKGLKQPRCSSTDECIIFILNNIIYVIKKKELRYCYIQHVRNLQETVMRAISHHR